MYREISLEGVFKKWSKMGLLDLIWPFWFCLASFEPLSTMFDSCDIFEYLLVSFLAFFGLCTMLLKCSISTSKKEITLPSEIWWSSSRNQEMKIGKKWQHHSDHPKRHELNVNVTSSKILQFFKSMSKHYNFMNFLFRFY